MNEQPSAELLRSLREHPRRLIEACDRLDAEESLGDFIRQAWPSADPSEYVHGWHIDAIAEHLEAVTGGEIRRLLINIPPSHMKSPAVSVFWPAWSWIRRPATRWLFASYAQSLSLRDNVRCRRLLESPWYQRNWGDRFRLTSDQNTKIRFDNDQGGHRLATSIDGALTGEGGDIVVVDDPHNVREAESDTVRAAAIAWWDEAMSTRLSDPKTGAFVIIMQRLHEADLAGHVLAKDQEWVHLCLPARYEPDHPYVWGGDPRAETDQRLLWPERFDAAALGELEVALGSYAAAGQLQQRPAPRAGGMFQRHWFALVGAAPAGARRVRYWDQAASAPAPGRDPDYTVGCKMALADGVYYIEDIRRLRGTPSEVEALTRQTAALDGPEVPIWIEQEPGSSGKNNISHYQRRVLVGFTVRGNRQTGPKERRAEPMSAAAEAGNVKLVAADWNAAFLDEIAAFPMGRHDDQADAATGGFNALAKTTRSKFTRIKGF